MGVAGQTEQTWWIEDPKLPRGDVRVEQILLVAS